MEIWVQRLNTIMTPYLWQTVESLRKSGNLYWHLYWVTPNIHGYVTPLPWFPRRAQKRQPVAATASTALARIFCVKRPATAAAVASGDSDGFRIQRDCIRVKLARGAGNGDHKNLTEKIITYWLWWCNLDNVIVAETIFGHMVAILSWKPKPNNGGP